MALSIRGLCVHNAINSERVPVHTGSPVSAKRHVSMILTACPGPVYHRGHHPPPPPCFCKEMERPPHSLGRLVVFRHFSHWLEPRPHRIPVPLECHQAARARCTRRGERSTQVRHSGRTRRVPELQDIPELPRIVLCLQRKKRRLQVWRNIFCKQALQRSALANPGFARGVNARGTVANGKGGL